MCKESRMQWGGVGEERSSSFKRMEGRVTKRTPTADGERERERERQRQRQRQRDKRERERR